MSESDAVTGFYRDRLDPIDHDRHQSAHWLRRWAHRTIHERFLRHVRTDDVTLDAGCGEGHLSVMLAERSRFLVGADISLANVQSARSRCPSGAFVVADLQRLPFRRGFDLVVSSHAVEHVPHPQRAMAELARVSRDRVVIAMPTCTSAVACVVLGRDTYWKVTRRTPFAWLLGLLRIVDALVRRTEGPNEGYEGHDVPHVWRFPWVVTRLVRRSGLAIEEVEAGPLLVPYVASHIPAARSWQERLDRQAVRPVMRWLGMGLHVAARVTDGAADAGGQRRSPDAPHPRRSA